MEASIENNKALLRAIKSKQIMKTSELLKFASNNYQIGLLAEKGEITSLGAGFYSHPSIDPFNAYILVVAKYYPQAIISNITALVIHKLSDERVDFVDVDVSRDQSIRNKIISCHRVPDSHLIGVLEMNFQGQLIRIYDLERTLCEAYKIEPEGHIFFKALKRYVSTGQVNPEKIKLYDATLKTKVLRSLMQELADG